MRTAHPPNPCCNPCTSRGYRPGGFGTRSIPAKAPKACQTRDLAHRLLLAPMQPPCFSHHRHGAHLVGFLLVKYRRKVGVPRSDLDRHQQSKRYERTSVSPVRRGTRFAWRGINGEGRRTGFESPQDNRRVAETEAGVQFSEPGIRVRFSTRSRVGLEGGTWQSDAPCPSDHYPRHTAASGSRACGSGRPLRTCR